MAATLRWNCSTTGMDLDAEWDCDLQPSILVIYFSNGGMIILTYGGMMVYPTFQYFSYLFSSLSSTSETAFRGAPLLLEGDEALFDGPLATQLSKLSKSFQQKKLDDGWPESVEEQGLLLFVWRCNFRNGI